MSIKVAKNKASSNQGFQHDVLHEPTKEDVKALDAEEYKIALSVKNERL